MGVPYVSIVIPTYNRAHCIREAIDSVLTQRYQDLELIVVDDGSSDGTPEIVAAYGGRVKLIRQENQGASSARNTGIRASTAEWIAFLDSDDTWAPDTLQVHVDGLRGHPSAVAHVVDTLMQRGERGPVSLFELRGTRAAYATQPYRERPLIDVLTTQFHIQGSMVRKEAILHAGCFDTALRTFEDIDLLSRVALEGPFVVSLYGGVNLRWRPADGQCLSQLFQKERLQNLHYIVRSCERLQDDPRLTRPERRYLARYLSGARCDLATQYRYERQWGSAITEFLRSAGDDPGFRSIARAFLAATGTAVYLDRLLQRKERKFRRSELD